MSYISMSAEERKAELEILRGRLEEAKKEGLKLDMSRGKPAPTQYELSMPMLSEEYLGDLVSSDGTDCRNYGGLTGIAECKELFGDILGVSPENVIIWGQSSLSIMYDCIIKAMVFGADEGSEPWSKQQGLKFLCPVPGYDRHFAITQEFGFEMINIPMTPAGPDMDLVREYAENDPSVKGIWCVPKYSNPQGYTYSAETVRAFAALKPAASDFKIFWDNAYVIHAIREEDDELLNIFDACKEYGSEDMVYEFASTSKITFAGAGVSAFVSGDKNIALMKKRMGKQTISADKINQYRHAAFLKNADGVRELMKGHALQMRPKFDCVQNTLREELTGLEIGSWTNPNGGYFVCFEGLENTAKRTVELCAEAGVKLTGAGAPFPYGKDPKDNVIRIAPSYPSIEQLAKSMKIFCLCERIAALESLL